MNSTKKLLPIIAMAVLVLVSLACGQASTVVPTLDSNTMTTAIVQTLSAEAALNTSTNTPLPTDTLAPIATPTSINTPEPYVYLFEVASLVFSDHDISRGNGAGIRVYMGEQKAYIFEIIGGGDCPSMPSGQGYLVRYPDTADVEWKDRRAIEELELFVVDDPLALYARDWTVYYNCP